MTSRKRMKIAGLFTDKVYEWYGYGREYSTVIGLLNAMGYCVDCVRSGDTYIHIVNSSIASALKARKETK